jgi:F-type H+-transporting ATPase subunit epsilon
MTLTVRVLAPDKTVFDSPADEVILPSSTGQLGILSGHAPLITALEPGVLRVRSKEWISIALSGGFAEIDKNEVTVLVNGAERGDTIDKAEAQSVYTEAQARFAKAEQTDNRQERFQAAQELKRARARLQAAGAVVEL